MSFLAKETLMGRSSVRFAARNQLPRLIFLLPFSPFFDPILPPPIPPKVEVHIKVVRDDALESTNRKPHLLGGHRKAIMVVLNIRNMKTRQGAS
jgi:hypothetical protein